MGSSAELNQNQRRCKDTAQSLEIFPEVLWEKSRERQICDREPERRESE